MTDALKTTLAHWPELPQSVFVAHSEADQRVQTGARPDLGTGERAHPQLDADAEEHQRHAQLGDDVQGFAALLPKRLEHEAGNEKADEGWQSDLLGEQSEEKGDGDEQCVHKIPDGASAPGC